MDNKSCSTGGCGLGEGSMVSAIVTITMVVFLLLTLFSFGDPKLFVYMVKIFFKSMAFILSAFFVMYIVAMMKIVFNFLHRKALNIKDGNGDINMYFLENLMMIINGKENHCYSKMTHRQYNKYIVGLEGGPRKDVEIIDDRPSSL